MKLTDAGIVDQNAQTLFLGGYFIHESFDLIFLRDIRGDWDDLARDILTIDLSHAVEFLTRPATDVDFGPVDSESLGCHQADARTASGDQGDLPGNIEELVDLEILIVVVLGAHG